MIENQRDEMRREFEGRLDDQREDDMQAVRQLALEYGRPGEEPLVAHVFNAEIGHKKSGTLDLYVGRTRYHL